MKTLHLRVRVAAAVAVTCIVIVSALGLALFTASEDLEETLVEQIVSEEMVYLVRHHLENPQIVVREPGPNIQYYVARNDADLQRIPEALRLLPVGQHEIGAGIDEKHVAVREVGGTKFVVAYDAGQHEVREQQFKRLLLFSIGIVVAVASALGYWVAGLVTRQITGLAARVASLHPGSPRAPLVERGQDPEVAALAGALDEYQTRIEDLLEREQEFTGNASHELRTPLTAIRTSCELLESDRSLPEKARTRVAAISDAAERMTGQIEMLLFLARAEASDGMDSVDLAESGNTAIEPLRHELARKNLRFDNRVAPGTRLSVNRHALHLVLANLLRNAVQYTATGSISLSWQAPVLTVLDTGPGVPEALRDRLFDRHVRGHHDSDGLGLGLSIVKRACDHCGWRIDVDRTDEGTAFRVNIS